VSRERWLTASLLWAAAGFLFPFLTPATALFAEGLQRSLSTATGMSEELAYRVAFTLFRIPLTGLLAILVAGAQPPLLDSVRPFARRWIIAAVVGASISTLIWLPTTLVALQIAGNDYDRIRMFLLVPGAALFAGLSSLAQWRAVRGRAAVTGQYVVVSALAGSVGVLGEFARL
jgi:hypothetical protein